MQAIDWIILSFTLLGIVSYGIWKTYGAKGTEDYIKGGNTSKWWTIGLSVMATQASAITFLSTPGQAFYKGMGFIQFYIGLPIAMVIICIVFIPIYKKLNVYTAYQYLEGRFDLKTRTLAASLFLVQRGLAAGITIFAPAIILSVVLGWPLNLVILMIGTLVILYTVSGGTKAVSITQTQQMAVIFIGMFIAFYILLEYLPDSISFSDALTIAGIQARMNILDFEFDLENRYNIWTGLIGGSFLALSYFGTDQSQVQRYLSGKSERESQLGLLFNGLLKVPMQFFILLVGIMLFIFYQFHYSPLNFNPIASEVVLDSKQAPAYAQLQTEHSALVAERKALLLSPTPVTSRQEELKMLGQREQELRTQAKTMIKAAGDAKGQDVETNDNDYVFIHFILNHLPRGLIGLLLAVILSAAMSSTASELNALASTTVVDLYQRNQKGPKSDDYYVRATKIFTLLWGMLAIAIACVANLFENLIELVNIIGSIFYGNILGIFLTAFFIHYIKGNAIFIAALITQTIIIFLYIFDVFPYLWLNFLGCLIVMTVALVLQTVFSFRKSV